MSTVDSSGFAASSAQPHQTGELGISLASYSEDLKKGGDNFKLMLQRVKDIGEETVFQFGDEHDGRDYSRMSFEVETAILANLLGSGKAVREGFLRAMTDLLAHEVDGCGIPDQWDPLSTTAAAYARQGVAA